MTKSLPAGLAMPLALALALLPALASLPGVQAHGAAAPREIDTRVLLDDDGLFGYGGCGPATEAGAPCTPEPQGLDVLALEVREAWLGDEPAIGFRLVYQAASVQPDRGLDLALVVNGTETTLGVHSKDGTSYGYAGFDRIDGPVDAFDGHPKAIDAWVRLSTLGATVGDELTGIRLDSTSGGAPDDLMPGTYMTNGVEAPHLPHDTDPAEALEAATPGTYTLKGPAPLVTLSADIAVLDTNASRDVTVRLANPLTSLAQTVTISAQADGILATVTPRNVTLEAGASRDVVVHVADVAATGNLTLVATTDLGGRATTQLLVVPPPAAQPTQSSSASVPPKDTPAPAGALLAIALVALAVVRRR